MKYVLIKEGEETDLLSRIEPNPPITDEADMASFRERLFTAQGAIEDALNEKWDKENDFEVGWDFDYSYWMAGGIYSERIYCVDYIKTVLKVLDTLPGNDPWVYHTVCEIIVNPNGKTIGEFQDYRGEFYLFKETAAENSVSYTQRELQSKTVKGEFYGLVFNLQKGYFNCDAYIYF